MERELVSVLMSDFRSAQPNIAPNCLPTKQKAVRKREPPSAKFKEKVQKNTVLLLTLIAKYDGNINKDHSCVSENLLNKLYLENNHCI